MNVAGQEAPQSTGASYIWKAGLFRFFLAIANRTFSFLESGLTQSVLDRSIVKNSKAARFDTAGFEVLREDD